MDNENEEEEEDQVMVEAFPNIPPQMAFTTSEELVLFMNGILLATMTWICTSRPDRQLLREVLPPANGSTDFQLTSQEIAYLMSCSWPKVFLLEAIEIFLKDQDGGRLIRLLASLSRTDNCEF